MHSAEEKYVVTHIVSGDLWAGAEVQVYNLVSALQQHAHVILFNEGILAEKLRENAIDVTVIEESKHGFISLCKQLSQVFKQLNSQIIHAHGYKESIVSTIANYFATKAITLRTEHGNPEFAVPFWKLHRYLQHKLNIYIAKHINKTVIAVSAQLKQALQTRIGLKNVCLIENAINIQEVEELANITPVKYPDDVFKIACVGRLVRLKRQDLLLELMSILHEKTDLKCQLYLFGDGPDHAYLSDLIHQYKLDDRVSLVGAVQPLYPHLHAMDLLVIPSDHEGLPMTLLEAIALRVPVIAHAVGGIPIVLQQGKGGTLVTAHDVHGYLGAVVEILEQPNKRKDKVDFAYEYIKQNYDIKSKVSEYDALYQELIQTYAK